MGGDYPIRILINQMNQTFQRMRLTLALRLNSVVGWRRGVAKNRVKKKGEPKFAFFCFPTGLNPAEFPYML
jgi:hypothetical protein